MSKQPSLSYKDAGVDIDAGEALVERIKGVAKRTCLLYTSDAADDLLTV